MEKRINLSGEVTSTSNITAKMTKLSKDVKRKEKLPYLQQEVLPSDTFAIPSNPLMFTLLAMFSGKPERIPRNLILKPDEERTEKEQEYIEKFFKSILKKDTSYDYTDEGKEIVKNEITAIVSDNPKIEAIADITDTLFAENTVFREEALAMYIKKSYGAEGLKHLLALLIAMEENGREGWFEWDINEHLERLGYRKDKGETFKTDQKKLATMILVIFCSLYLHTERKDENKENFRGYRLFSIQGYDVKKYKGEIISGKVQVTPNPIWYKNITKVKGDNETLQYTKLLKKVVKENVRERALAIYLTPLLAMFWKIKTPYDIKLKNLLDWCSRPSTKTEIKKILSEFEYMKEKQYLGGYELKDEHITKETVVTLSPPDWLQEELNRIKEKKDKYKPKVITRGEKITPQQFKKALEGSGLTQGDFANVLGITRQHVNYLKNGKRTISLELSNKIKEKFPFAL